MNCKKSNKKTPNNQLQIIDNKQKNPKRETNNKYEQITR